MVFNHPRWNPGWSNTLPFSGKDDLRTLSEGRRSIPGRAEPPKEFRLEAWREDSSGHK